MFFTIPSWPCEGSKRLAGSLDYRHCEGHRGNWSWWWSRDDIMVRWDHETEPWNTHICGSVFFFLRVNLRSHFKIKPKWISRARVKTNLNCDEVGPLNSSPREHFCLISSGSVCRAFCSIKSSAEGLNKIEKWSAVLAVANLEFSSSVWKKRKNWRRSQFEQQQIYQGEREGSDCSCQNETRPRLKSLQMLFRRCLQLCLLFVSKEGVWWYFFISDHFQFFLNVYVFLFCKMLTHRQETPMQMSSSTWQHTDKNQQSSSQTIILVSDTRHPSDQAIIRLKSWSLISALKI